MLTVQPEHLDGFLRLAPASLPSATRDTLEEMTSWGHPSIVLTPKTHGRVLERRQGTVGMSQTD